MGIHRGDMFEEMVNWANIAYQNRNIAEINKISTPVKVLKRTGNRIVAGYFEEKSTLDYVGVYKGIPIAFDAKETSEANRFPLGNIHEHQINFMKRWVRNKGVTFMLIRFSTLNKVYRLDWITLEWYWKKYKENKGKRGFGSIPINEFECNCKEIVSNNGIVLDYLMGLED